MLCPDAVRSASHCPLPGATLEKYQPHLENEVRHTWEVYKSGIVRDIYFRQDRPGVTPRTTYSPSSPFEAGAAHAACSADGSVSRGAKNWRHQSLEMNTHEH